MYNVSNVAVCIKWWASILKYALKYSKSIVKWFNKYQIIQSVTLWWRTQHQKSWDIWIGNLKVIQVILLSSVYLKNKLMEMEVGKINNMRKHQKINGINGKRLECKWFASWKIPIIYNDSISDYCLHTFLLWIRNKLHFNYSDQSIIFKKAFGRGMTDTSFLYLVVSDSQFYLELLCYTRNSLFCLSIYTVLFSKSTFINIHIS